MKYTIFLDYCCNFLDQYDNYYYNVNALLSLG